MQIALRNIMLTSRRPYKYEVEYLESTGTQYIDTGLNYFADFEIAVKLRESVSNKALGTATLMCMERASATNPYWRLTINGTGYNSSASIVDFHVMSWKNGVFAADGVTAHTVSNPFASGKMTLFGAGGGYFPNMIYTCKLWDANGTLVRDFIPVVDWNDKPAMYDKVSGKLFYNAGTGEFAVGRKIIPIEYLESTGAQRIDTGVDPFNSTSFDIICKYTVTALYNFVTVWASTTDSYETWIYGNSNLAVRINNLRLDPGQMIKGETYNLWVSGKEGKNITVSINEEQKIQATQAWTSPTTTLNIFGGYSNTGGSFKAIAVQIIINDVLVRNFIPAKDEDGVGFMFDKVTHTIYDNTGTGSFITGPEIK